MDNERRCAMCGQNHTTGKPWCERCNKLVQEGAEKKRQRIAEQTKKR